ncbi:MAG: SGNH/GDSL hydrolase family protein [Verrucomicrobiales bacterium]|nr:SGNH/GDSL hydrolase family protein [Verrucomicrobiales bacterium]
MKFCIHSTGYSLRPNRVQSYIQQGTVLLFSVISAVSLVAQQKAAELPFNPQDGETVVFLGDSITHQCLYTQYLEDFFITRYPDRRIRFHNAGVSGDKVGDCLTRYDDDVAALNPDYVFVLLGMNDGQYEDFSKETVATYQAGMAKLFDRIDASGAKAIALSPTMFDHGTVNRRINDETWRFRTRSFSENYNALMAWFGAWVLEESARRGVPFVNLWGPLNEHTIVNRRTDPAFTMIDDAIHPQASGQMVMAFEILSQLGVERSGANSIAISKRGKKWIGRNLKDLTVNQDTTEISFSHTAGSLPWVIPAEQASEALKWGLPSDGRLGYKITKAGHKLSGDRLKIAGLAPGNYEVEIDGNVVGKWNHITLGTKIEIQEKEQTPQYQQALEVALLNQQRNDQIIRPMRGLWSKIKGTRKKEGADVSEMIEQAKALAEKENQALDAIYTTAKPVERKWVIRRVE